MLPHFKTILYTTDLSENARPAFKHAVGLARRYGAKITFLHVIPEVEAVRHGYFMAPLLVNVTEEKIEKYRKEAIEKIRQKLEAFAREELGNGPDALNAIVGIEVLTGNAVAEILKASDRLDADLLVFGSHGKGHMKYAFLGSVAEKVLKKTRRPTLIVPLPMPKG